MQLQQTHSKVLKLLVLPCDFWEIKLVLMTLDLAAGCCTMPEGQLTCSEAFRASCVLSRGRMGAFEVFTRSDILWFHTAGR